MDKQLYYFFIELTEQFNNPIPLDFVCLNRNKYPCFKGYTFKQLQEISKEYGYNLNKNIEYDIANQVPWIFTKIN